VALLVGLSGGTVLAAAAGARRTDTAYPRLLRWSHAPDLLVSAEHTGLATPKQPRSYYDALRSIPGVATVAPLAGYDSSVSGQENGEALLNVAVDDTYLRTIDRPKVLRGRMVRRERADEIVVNPTMADRFHLRPGARVGLTVARTDSDGADLSTARRLSLRVVGVVVAPGDVLSTEANDATPQALGSSALFDQLGGSITAYDGAMVRLAPGASAGDVVRAVRGVARPFHQTTGNVLTADQHRDYEEVQQGIQPQALALALFAALAGLTAFVVVGQVVARQLSIDARHHPDLQAMGMSRRELVVTALAGSTAIASVGAVIAAVVAVAASPLMPIGPARLAEPEPGLAVNWAVVAGGAAIAIALMVLRALPVAWRATVGARSHVGETGERPSIAARLLHLPILPPSASMGIRLAVDGGRGRRGLPARTALAGTALAVAAMAAVTTFDANLVALVGTPRLYGQTWDLSLDAGFGALPPERVDAVLRSVPGVTGWTFGDHYDVTIAGHDVPAIALARGRGPMSWPTLLDGRPPRRDREIVLGRTSLSRAGVDVGERGRFLPLGFRRPVSMRVVGEAVLPFFGRGSFSATGLGQGAIILDSAPNPEGFNFVLVHVAPGPDRGEELARVGRALASVCPKDQGCVPTTSQRPAGVRNYARVVQTPKVLAAVLALLALATLLHFLVVSTFGRRRDLGVLKTIGFTPRQVRATIAWQATTVIVVALGIGVPLGVLGGRAGWSAFARYLGADPTTQTPVLVLLVAVPVAIVVTNLLAFGPGLIASRLRPAAVLRSE
jgi:ABC-type antimicrobial peptide transport system permease subunit